MYFIVDNLFSSLFSPKDENEEILLLLFISEAMVSFFTTCFEQKFIII